MPTSDRKPRARRKTDEPALSGLALARAMHAASGDPEAWAALRPCAIRGLTKGTLKPEQAARIFDAYGRKPYLMPSLPPSQLDEAE
ncbi:hypothetical protein H6CHR_03199 [Variovorax sp. PBL-H6]|uniref:hypothetical protein n=1 Tax=Variovorax sp. PBL-H6 TaxID=434009 RepID=UPI001319A609|nr:hypothetical protein [Variovorax sp. PBL-H6]VTU29458.1 hypothetical protein H6CHR_03199 [Variovorax sp. PBL-H6]